MNWINVKEALPCPQGEQINVIFCSSDWSWAIVGMFSYLDDEPIWADYDQQNDKYYDWDGEPPNYWMLMPKPPAVK